MTLSERKLASVAKFKSKFNPNWSLLTHFQAKRLKLDRSHDSMLLRQPYNTNILGDKVVIYYFFYHFIFRCHKTLCNEQRLYVRQFLQFRWLNRLRDRYKINYNTIQYNTIYFTIRNQVIIQIVTDTSKIITSLFVLQKYIGLS